MLCDNCKEKEANVHMVKMINGEKTEMHLCEACATQSEGFFHIPQFDIQKIFPYLAGSAVSRQESLPDCPTCGWSSAKLESSGKVGCCDCYHHFRAYVGPILERIQNANVHHGKVPKRAGGIDEDENVLCNLKAKLNACVAEENFEEAARLRDRIRELEGGISGE